ncbi:hypothetical protein AVEN_238411-1 [Araneus ventricosus]|uniref:Uncharacterized protein n=1 Tax=Araneus ventricosus TaxID=182803 RepID=A0A4Y2DMI9_ARAVE|nr:hypothetical protein AVEN_238411-1 [Araneus ventricosus]
MIGRSKEVDRDLSTVPTGSCNCGCVLGRYSTTRCSAGRITTAIYPKRLNAATWALGTEALKKSRKTDRAAFTKAYNKVEELIVLEGVLIFPNWKPN